MAWADVVAAREPRPHLLGLELEPFPYPSALSVLMRVTRLTALVPSEWNGNVGLHFRAALPDLFVGKVARPRLKDALGLSTTKISSWWPEEAWSPLRTDGMLDRDRRPVRWCWKCANFGFHTTLFQLPSIDRCPWHNYPLLDQCPRCHKPGSAIIDTQGQLGRCDCGFDWLSIDTATVRMWDFPTEKAETWLSNYLSWAAKERERRFFVAPERVSQWRAGFAALAEPPEEIRHPCGLTGIIGTRVAAFDDPETVDPPSSQFWGWGALADARPLTFVPLPTRTHDRVADATQRVIQELSRSSGQPLELVAARPAGGSSTSGLDGKLASERFIAPHGVTADGSGWLDLSALDLDTLQLCGRLVDGVTLKFDALPDEADRSRQTARAEALGRIRGRGLSAAALEEILLTGYRQGLSAILRAQLNLGPPDEWWLPVVEYEGVPTRITRLRVCWVRTPVPRLGRTTPAPPQGPNPVKKSHRPTRSRRSKRGASQAARR
jgi:hypothetical protein